VQEPLPPATSPDTTTPSMDPERAAALRRQMIGLATSIIDRALADVAAAPSTASVSERLLLAALRPQLPKLRLVLLSKLSEANPAGIEAVLGAVATAIESILYYAPGDPLPRRRFDFTPDGSIILVDDV
jgi:hypothetical protein